MIADLRVNGDLLWDSLMEIAKIGALPAGGCGRLALSDDDQLARDLFTQWAEAAGCVVRFDQLGNMFARRPGRLDELAPLGIGSHLDTQPHGGKFDDACQVARRIPTAMVVVPCKDGLSHNEAEWAEPAHLTASCNVLFHAALSLSQTSIPLPGSEAGCDGKNNNPQSINMEKAI